MPIYEFTCAGCGEGFEKLVFGSDPGIVCPRCGSGEVHKKVSACAIKAGFKFVGTGKKASAGGGCAGCASSSCSSCGG